MYGLKMSHYIFDFDGTIVDSFDYVLGFLAKEAGREKPVGKEAEKFRNTSMKDMALELGVPMWRLPLLYFKGRRVMRAHMDNLRAFAGMTEVIHELSDSGHKLYIISSNSGKNIRRFLIKKSLSQYFHVVKGGAGLFGKDNLMKQMMKRQKMTGDVFYVGDETTDIRAAKVAGVKSVAVSWGFASKEELAAKEPDFLAMTPDDILRISRIL